jgi:DNA invertase Pin-like site-specific DNA recombinase
VVNILASIFEFERELIHARMTEGSQAGSGQRREVRPQVQAQSFPAPAALERKILHFPPRAETKNS